MTGINKRIGYHKEAQNVVFFIAVVAQKCNRTYQLMYFFWGGAGWGWRCSSSLVGYIEER